MKKTDSYIRVGTTYYKMVEKPLLSGEMSSVRVPWSIETIRQDHGKDFISTIPKYDDFCIVPSHTCRQERVGRCFNLYEPFEHSPKPGECQTVLSVVRHIFGEQYELGLDYIQLLYLHPVEKLPIILLLSKERNTGKSTFLNLLKDIFGKNMTFNTNEDFRSQFNSDWANKLLIGIEEVLFDKQQDSERLKNLSTAFQFKSEAKGKDRVETAFFGKFLLCSNNELNPILIQPGETRYWVRKLSPLGKTDTEIRQKLKREIPAFLHFLLNRKLSSEKKSRMWFDFSLIKTEALQRIINYNRNAVEMEIKELLTDIMDTQQIDNVSFCLNDLRSLLMFQGIDTDISRLRKIVKNHWELMPSPNTLTYTTYNPVGDLSQNVSFSETKKTGRFYTVSREFLNAYFLMN